MNIKGTLSELCKSIRKFGLDHCDLEEMISNVNVLMRFNAVNIDKRNTKPIPIFTYCLIIFGFLCYYYIYFFSMIWCTFVLYPRTGYFIGSIIVFSIGSYSESCAIRFLFIVINRKLIRDVVEVYRLCNDQVPPDSRFSRNILKHLRIVKKRATIIWLGLIINAYIYLILPFFRPGKQFAENRLIIYGLDPMTVSPNYEIAQTMTCMAIPTLSHSLANCMVLVIILYGYTEAQLLSLSEELLCMWDDAEMSYNETPHEENVTKAQFTNTFVQQRLRFIIKLHVDNMTMLKRLENVLRVSMALEFLVLMAGLIAELLGGIENTFLQIPFTFAQIFMNCYLGQKIINSSNSFETAVYNCKWENFNKSNMKTVLIMLQNSQKTLQLSAGGVAILGFECLMTVVKSCYSFYTTLQSTLK
ncbi:uncharacterized protein LOC119840150 [Zerene cesonia]|uniref:uncharacterized protein LOC119840150 n=1 Tax=Zerene cesonia TaxID=33412 RepID=UPI0018E58677|nr:uncharacterized protein LOC119840150 [Zerene cesonia]